MDNETRLRNAIKKAVNNGWLGLNKDVCISMSDSDGYLHHIYI